jgi:hypothetical protein
MSPLFFTWLRFHEGKRLYQAWISVTKIKIFFRNCKMNIALRNKYLSRQRFNRYLLRNGLNTVLAAHFSDPDWIIKQTTGFMSDPSLSPSHYFLRTCVQKTEYNLIRKSIPVTAGKTGRPSIAN